MLLVMVIVTRSRVIAFLQRQFAANSFNERKKISPPGQFK